MQVRVDECLLNDVRFKALVEHLEEKFDTLNHRHCEDLALALCVRGFWLAQKYWRDDRQLVPVDIWTLAKQNELLQFGLAEEREGGVYVRGSRDFFDWYHGKAEAGRQGGINSGKSRRSKKIEADDAKQRSTASEARSCSVSVSVSDSVSVSKKKKSTPPPSAFDLRLAQDWAAHASSKAPHLRPDPTKYADAIRKLREKVGLTEAQVEETLAWIRQSDFWAANALSPASLLNVGKSGVRKIDTIRAQMLERPGEGREMTQADWDRVFAGGQQP